jgi:hypothetical protein
VEHIPQELSSPIVHFPLGSELHDDRFHRQGAHEEQLGDETDQHICHDYFVSVQDVNYTCVVSKRG